MVLSETREKRRLSLSRWSGWLPFAIGSGVLIFSPFTGTGSLDSWLLFAFGLLACLGVSVICHELAHFLVGALLGLQPFRVVIGDGETAYETRFRGVKWVFKEAPNTGYVICLYPDLPLIRTREFLMTLAGPLINACLCASAAFFLWFPPAWFAQLHQGDYLNSVLFLMVLANALLSVSSLWPRVHRVDRVWTYSDGLQLLRTLFRSREKFDLLRASTNYLRALEIAEETIHRRLRSDAIQPAQTEKNATAASIRYKILLAETTLRDQEIVFRYPLGKKWSDAEERKQALDGFATWVVLSGAIEYLEEADRYTEELLRMAPNEWTVLGTRGAVLIETGRVAEGRRLLLEVMDHDQSPFDRAITAAFLAMGAIKTNQLDEATGWLRTAREIDPECVPLERVEKLLASSCQMVNGDGCR